MQVCSMRVFWATHILFPVNYMLACNLTTKKITQLLFLQIDHPHNTKMATTSPYNNLTAIT